MAFNPLAERASRSQAAPQLVELNVQPDDKREVDPSTHCRIITMNGIEEKRAMARRIEQQQQAAAGGGQLAHRR